MSIAGQRDVHVCYGSQSQKLPLLVVVGSGPTLFGRNWLRYIRLNWKTIRLATLEDGRDQVEILLECYPQVFSQQLGNMRKFQATLRVRREVKPVFCKPRAVPFALKEAIGKELDRLQSEGVLSSSEWASPIVPVPKDDGRIRLCGDYKATVNPVWMLTATHSPEPTTCLPPFLVEKRFSKLDLTHTYFTAGVPGADDYKHSPGTISAPLWSGIGPSHFPENNGHHPPGPTTCSVLYR